MTLTRVLTALVLIPIVVALVLFASTALVAIATAVVTILALWEYFALGDAIGHRAYRLWTIFCALLIIYVQWAAVPFKYAGQVGDVILFGSDHFHRHEAPHSFLVLFVFILGLTALTLWTQQP